MSASLRILFAGTPDFAAAHLDALCESGYEVCGVLTQPDRPKGRGRKLAPSPVKVVAEQRGIAVWQPQSLKGEAEQQQIRDYQADLMIVVAYGLILPKAVLVAPRLGCINVHGSLLPAWRGAAPIQRAIMAGDTESGVTIMQMDEGLDTGDMLLKARCPILPNDTSSDLHDRLIEIGKPALLEALEAIALGRLAPEPQDDAIATYAHKLTKEEARLNWQLSATELALQVRGLNPWPVATTLANSETIRVWKAEIAETDSTSGDHARPGTIVALENDAIRVKCGTGDLRITQVQLPGGKALLVKELLNSKRAYFENLPGLG